MITKDREVSGSLKDIFLMFYAVSVIGQDEFHLGILFPEIQIILDSSLNFEDSSMAQLVELTLWLSLILKRKGNV